MPRPKRRWDVIEIHAERGLSYGFSALCIFGFAWLLFAFRGEGMFVPLAIILSVIATVFLGMAANKAVEIKKVASYPVICPLCEFENELISKPSDDFVCVNCDRLVPILDGQPLVVSQVKCGYCGELNYFSEKTEFLICEVCHHQVPVDTEASRKSTGKPRIAESFVVTDDSNVYEFILVAHGHKTEELIEVLQHMLALNRNQVKQMLTELPVTLLTGITRRKAEILQAQLALHEAATEFRPMSQV